MKTLINPPRLGVRAAALCLLALAAVLCQSREARAQFTTSGNNTTTTNNVGVGTATPSGKLTVAGNDSIPDDTLTLTVPSGSLFGPSIKMDGTGSAGGRAWTISSTGPKNTGGAGTLRFYDITADATRMILDGAGNVGIGTVTPASKLDVSAASGITLRTSGASAGFSIFDRSSVPGDQLVFQGNAGGYSMLNTATKNANFGSEKLSGIAMWTVDNTYTPNATQFQLQNSPAHGGVIFTQKFGTGVQGDKKVSFQTAWNQLSAPTQLVLDTTGNVGIGTASPTAKLHVAGNITVDGNINAKYQDVAEWVPSKQKLSAGTVVIVDPAGVNGVLASKASYDTSVAGVISAQPGIALGEKGEGKVLVATTGRVKVRVDASRGAIRAGDLLVSGDREGYAIKSEPIQIGKRKLHAPGTIIGKALEPLEKGTGEILVLLSLQ